MATRVPKMKKTNSYSYVQYYFENIGWSENFNFDIFFAPPTPPPPCPKNAYLGPKEAENQKTKVTFAIWTHQNGEIG